MDFVVNEWLPEYFLPTATTSEKELLSRFIQKFIDRLDRIVILRPSPFSSKFYNYANIYRNNQNVYLPLKFFITKILLDPLRATIISEVEDLPVATFEALHTLGTNYKSDEYLFQAAMRTESKMIITTDEKLFRAMENDAVFNVVLLGEFLKNY